MKNLHSFTTLFALVLFLTCNQPATAQNQSIKFSSKTIFQNNRSDYVFDLPFFEDWESHTFTHNLWETSDDAWAIDIYNGNDGASAKFQGSSNQTNYSSTLTSNWMDGSAVGTDTLKFDLKLSDIAANGTEWFYIKVFDSVGYHTIDSMANNGSFDWTTYTFNITSATGGNNFKVVFEASGNSSVNLSGWYIDNIRISRGCDPPTDLDGEVWDGGDNSVFAHIKWNAPDCLIPTDPWEHWDSGSNFTAVAACSHFTIAARWDAGSLVAKDGDTISEIKYFLNDNQFDYMILHIWTGTDAANIIYTDTVINPVAGTWSTHLINDTIILDASLAYWIGYDLVGILAGTFPAGTDAGPAVTGYGDKISSDNGISWDNLTDFGLSYNWNIEMYVAHPAPADSALKKFVLYKSLDGYDYQSYDTIDYVSGQTMFDYLDSNVAYNNIYWYKLNAVWAANSDTCISPFAKNKMLPMEDYIEVFVFDGINENINNDHLTLYPNPAANTITLEAETELKEIEVFDISGKSVLQKQTSSTNKITLNIERLQSGIYLVKAKTTQGVLLKKFVKR